MRYFLLSLSLLIWWESSYANGAGALDRLILHKKEEMKKTRAAKGEKLNQELNEFFDELINSQEKDLKRMTDLRRKLFPDLKKKVEDKSEYLSEDIANELRRVEDELYSLARKFQERLSEREAQEEAPLKIEISDKKNGYDILAEVPGVAREDIKVSINKNDLTIEAKRKESSETRKGESTTSEFSYGEFKRVIKLRENVNAKSMKVNYENGLLRIHLDKV